MVRRTSGWTRIIGVTNERRRIIATLKTFPPETSIALAICTPDATDFLSPVISEGKVWVAPSSLKFKDVVYLYARADPNSWRDPPRELPLELVHENNSPKR
jgi:hypothetical protein